MKRLFAFNLGFEWVKKSEIGCNGTKRGYSHMSRKFLTPKDEYAESRTVKAFEALTVLQTQALTISGHYYLNLLKSRAQSKLLCWKGTGTLSLIDKSLEGKRSIDERDPPLRNIP